MDNQNETNPKSPKEQNPLVVKEDNPVRKSTSHRKETIEDSNKATLAQQNLALILNPKDQLNPVMNLNQFSPTNTKLSQKDSLLKQDLIKSLPS